VFRDQSGRVLLESDNGLFDQGVHPGLVGVSVLRRHGFPRE
jgi:hypothetical protein